MAASSRQRLRFQVSEALQALTLDSKVRERKRALEACEREATEAAVSAKVQAELGRIREALSAIDHIQKLLEAARGLELGDLPSAESLLRAPETLTFQGCEAYPAANADFNLTEHPETEEIRPVYATLKVGKKRRAQGVKQLFCYFRSGKSRTGWCIHDQLAGPSGTLIGFCPSQAMLPPRGGWRIIRDGAHQADPGGFTGHPLGPEELRAMICSSQVPLLRMRFAEEQAKSKPATEDSAGQRRQDKQLQISVLEEADVICAQMITAGGVRVARQQLATGSDFMIQCCIRIFWCLSANSMRFSSTRLPNQPSCQRSFRSSRLHSWHFGLMCLHLYGHGMTQSL
jgi:hypothetical protein